MFELIFFYHDKVYFIPDLEVESDCTNLAMQVAEFIQQNIEYSCLFHI